MGGIFLSIFSVITFLIFIVKMSHELWLCADFEAAQFNLLSGRI